MNTHVQENLPDRWPRLRARGARVPRRHLPQHDDVRGALELLRLVPRARAPEPELDLAFCVRQSRNSTSFWREMFRNFLPDTDSVLGFARLAAPVQYTLATARDGLSISDHGCSHA